MNTPRIITLDEITRHLSAPACIETIEGSFRAYSKGLFTPAQIGHLNFTSPPGDTHIKAGYRQDGQHFVVKIASSFYDNPTRSLPSSSGMMLLFDRHTGQPAAVLLDRGYLTDVRTAAAGAVAARLLAPEHIECIGIVGAGIQARLQLQFLKTVTRCRRAVIWARDPRKAAAFDVDDFSVTPADSIRALCDQCRLIVTTTPSPSPLIEAGHIQPGTHITAVGADTPAKQELDAAILGRADIVAVDSRAQCTAFGELSHTVKAGMSLRGALLELGEISDQPALGRNSPQQITIADLTGLAIQDLDIATQVLNAL